MAKFTVTRKINFKIMIHFLNAHIHFRSRSRISNIEKYPSKKPNIRLLDNLVIIGSVIGPLFVAPQVLLAWRSADISSLSLPTWSSWLGLSLLWGVYGMVHKEKPIIISSLMNGSMQAAVIIAIIVRS